MLIQHFVIKMAHNITSKSLTHHMQNTLCVCVCVCVCVCMGTRGKKLHSVENSKDYQQNTHYVELQVRKEWYRTMVLKL